jgi:hypothetical protein
MVMSLGKREVDASGWCHTLEPAATPFLRPLRMRVERIDDLASMMG